MCKLRYILLWLFFSVLSSAFAQKVDSLAEKVLLYQLPNGGWPKQLVDKSVVKYELALNADLLEKIRSTGIEHATIDNHATTREIELLLEAFQHTQNANYLAAAKKGIDYLLSAQYENGGWPQYFPDKHLYRAQVTFNDNAMVNVLNVLLKVAHQKQESYKVLVDYRQRAQAAVDKGIACILKTQVLQNGHLSIWAAQYDPETLQPAQARAFEPIALSTSESVGVIRFLMKIQNPSSAVKTAIKAGVAWFDKNKQTDFKYQRDKTGVSRLVPSKGDLYWGRFYEISTNQILFGDRDGKIKYDFEELSLERRNGYVWYGDFAAKLLQSEYPKWLNKNLN